MKYNKRGAMELSISTIIIIVIGVTLLSLGLILVRGIMSKTEELTSGAFANAEGEIGKLSGVDSLLTIAPNNIEINKGGAKDVDVIIANFEEQIITASVKAESSDPKVKCVFKDKVPEGSTSDTYTIESGEQVKITLVVDDKGSVVGLKHCVLEVMGSGISGDKKGTLLINIKQKKGVFG